MRVVHIVGARPQFIKLAPLYQRFGHHFPSGEQLILHTGQHFDPDMSEIFFRQFGLPDPTVQLNIHSLPHGAMTGRMLEAIERELNHNSPDIVVVYGDTNSTLAGALAAKKLGLPIAHVEAGLRSHLPHMPEEINRVLTDRISDFLFCPTQTAVSNLHREGYRKLPVQIILTGDIMLDAARNLEPSDQSPNQGVISDEPYALVSLHRASNTDDPRRLAEIVEAFKRTNERLKLRWMLHPRTEQALATHRLSTLPISVIPPQDYFSCRQLVRSADLVITDSGGLQKEAYFHETPCIVLRDQTEWIELLATGTSKLSTPADLVHTVQVMHATTHNFSARPFGDSDAADRIWSELATFHSTS